MATNRFFQEGFQATPGTLARSQPILTDYKGIQIGFDLVMAELNALQAKGTGAPFAGSASDVPTSYAGAALNLLRVNAAAAGIEFVPPGRLTVKTIAATSYTLVLADAGCLLVFTSATAVSVTVPLNASVTFGLSDSIVLLQYGAGQVSVAPIGANTVSSTNGYLTTRGQFAQIGLTQPYVDSWILIGDRYANGSSVNSQSAAYTTVLADAYGTIYHPTTDASARIWTIDSNANVPQPLGTRHYFENDAGAGVVTIAMGGTDTLVFVGTGTTGSRSLAAGANAVAVKVLATRWRIAGSSGLT